MPSKVTVKIKTIESQDRGGKDGYIIKGYDSTNQQAFNKFIFETTQKGDLTKIAEVMQTATPGEWYEITVDDSKWKNATYAVKVSAPEGGEPPAKSSGGGGGYSKKSSGGGGGGSSDRMSKEEWAAKDAKKELSMARHKALQVAVAACAADGGKVTKPKMEQIEKMAHRFTSFLLTGDFAGKLDTPAITKEEPKTESDGVDNTPTGGADDDIPF